MTVSVQTTSTASVASGATTVFPYGFKIAHADDLTVTVDGVEQTTGFSVTNVGDASGGDVVFDVAPTAGKKVVRYLNPILKRETDYQQFGDWIAQVINLDFDRVWLAVQSLALKVGLCVQAPISSASGVLPDPEANHIIGWNDAGDGFKNYAPVDNTLLSASLSASSGSSLVGHIHSGVGAVATTVQTKLRESVSVKDFGAVGDGVTDDTSAFNAAHVEAKNSGGSVFIPPSSNGYVLAGTVNVQSDMFGASVGVYLITSSETLDVLQVTQPSVTLRNFGIRASVTRSAGYFINIVGVNYTHIERIIGIDWFNGISLEGAGVAYFHVANCYFGTSTPGGHGVNIETTTNSVDVVLDNVLIGGPASGAQCASGVRVKNVGDITLRHVSTVKTGHGLNICPGTGDVVQALICSDSYFDSGSGAGVNFGMVGTGSVKLAKFSNTWACTNANGFYLSSAGTGTLLRSEFVNCTGSNNSGTGFLINHSGVTDTTVIGSSFSANTHGMYAVSGVTLFKFIGNRSGPCGEFAANTGYGLVLGGSNDNYNIDANDYSGNGTGAASIVAPAGTPGATNFITNNQGIITRASGTQLLNSGATTTVVAHGLASTPDVKDIQLSFLSGWGTSQQFWISTVTSTEFTINTAATPGAGVTLNWKASTLGG